MPVAPVLKFFKITLIVLLFLQFDTKAQKANTGTGFTKQDTLRGSNGAGRYWWNLLHYDITVEPDYSNKQISGISSMTIRMLEDMPGTYMQIDLQEPMNITSVSVDDIPANYTRDGNVFFISFPAAAKGSIHRIACHFNGKPRQALRAPWDGGWIWTKDKSGNPWMTVACQGLGASVWYPCKDYQADEPDSGAVLRIIVPDSLQAVGNGRLQRKTDLSGKRVQYDWAVKNPINNYNIVPYIGKYEHYAETYAGEKGTLDMAYWVLPYNLEKARIQMKDAPRMMKALEYWFGPYPFYEDGFKIVETPHLGMEHQSAIAYGNGYKNGYMGTDLSSTGWGLKWDFIIVHESGHEWFANSITTKDIADMWIHEGFTTYSETLFTGYYYGKEAGNDYVIGLRAQIDNDKPIIGTYGVNNEGSGDMYSKAANLIHIIRQLVQNDSTFRDLLRQMNKTFYHQTVTGREVEDFIIHKTGIGLKPVFDQYLRTTKIPVLEYKITERNIRYRWSNTVKGFKMPVMVSVGKTAEPRWIMPTSKWKKIRIKRELQTDSFAVDRNFYIQTKEIK